jgi:hypothetical protein
MAGMQLGPVQLLVVEFDKPEWNGRMREELERLCASDTIRLVDVLLVRKTENDEIEVIQQSDLSPEQRAAGAYISALIGLGTEDGASGAGPRPDGHVLNDVQVWYAADAIPRGAVAGIALIEHRWAIPLRSAIVESGGRLLADAWIHPVDLVEVGLLSAEPVAA